MPGLVPAARKIGEVPPVEEVQRLVNNADIQTFFDSMAERRERWKKKNEYFYQEHYNYLRFLIPEGKRVLDLGSGTGRLLHELKPSLGVGVDISEKMVAFARSRHPELSFIEGDIEQPGVLEQLEGPFDYIVLSNTVGYLKDCQQLFNRLHQLCDQNTRIIVSYYSWFWEPLLWMAERVGQKMPQTKLNWLSTGAVSTLLELADFEPIKSEWRQLIPKRLFGLGPVVNRYLSPLPIVRRACLKNYLVARSSRKVGLFKPSVSVVVPAKNEAGNIESAVRRMPRFCPDLEIVFVEGGSRDGTAAQIERVIAEYPDYDIKFVQQSASGKWNAVKEGFAAARGDILMILDADLTVPPEDLPKFYYALIEGKGEFINGSRMIYPQEDQAMRTLNQWANSAFSVLFTWLLNQRFTDTLCGTKVLTRENFNRIEENCGYFGDFDPFGDFYLIFGAQKQNLKTVEIPIRYRAREYGETQISRWRHGWLLLRMVMFAFRKFKAF